MAVTGVKRKHEFTERDIRIVSLTLAMNDVVSCSINLGRLQKAETNILLFQDSLFQSAVIAYSRPFTKCKFPGAVKRKRILEESIIPTEYLELHKEIISERDHVCAHTDVDFRNPIIFNVKNEEGTLSTVFENYISVMAWKDKLANFEKLAENVLLKVKHELDHLRKVL